jgi:hypothetical protein
VLGVVAAAAGALLGLGFRGGQGLAHLARHQAPELFGLVFQDLGRAQEHPGALRERGVAVLAEGLGGERELAFYLLVGEGFEGLDLLARRRVDRCYRHGGPPYG